jgi:triacylglycerol lipase
MRRAELVVLLLLAIGAGCGGAALALVLRGHHTAGVDHAAAPAAPSAPAPAPAPPPPPTTMDSAQCRPPVQHPDPVMLVHGTFGLTSWSLIGPTLAQRGYCVFTIQYGGAGTMDIGLSAHQLARDVDRILALTKARRVAIIGHSEGGLMPRYYIKLLGGAGKVSKLIGLAPSNHGTTNPLALAGAIAGCTACGQQLAWGSGFLDRLNAGTETPPPVDYTVVQTRYDQVVTPYQSAFLNGTRARVTNVTLQDRCPGDTVGHLDVPTDPVALQWVENALAVPGPADPAFRPTC